MGATGYKRRFSSLNNNGAYRIAWMETARTSFYLAIILYAAILPGPYTTVRCAGPTVVPYSDMNKTIRDQFLKQMFLTELKTKLGTDNIHRNTSTYNGRTAQLFPEKVTPSGPLNSLSHNFTNVNTLVSVKGMGYMTGMTPPDLVYSESEEKNVLTFKLKPKTVRNKTLVNRINLWLFVWTKESKTERKTPPSSTLSVSSSSPSPTTRDLKGDDQRDRRKGKRIKIRVFLSNVNGSRGQRIAELKTRIDGSVWGKLGLPVSLINTLAESDTNNTLRLRIECKRCSGKTQVVMPGNGGQKRCRQRQGMKKKKDGRMHRWRKHCVKAGNTDDKLIPFIVIEEKTKSSQGRFKREVNITRCVSNVVCNNWTLSGKQEKCGENRLHGRHNLCSLVKTHIEFSDLKLDYVIVHPSGFEYATCIRGGGNMLVSTSSGADNQIRGIADLISEKIRQHKIIYSQNSSQTGHTQISHGHSSRFYDNQHLPPEHQLHQQQYNHQHLGRQYRRYNHKRSRLKSPEICKPTEINHLDIVYLTDEHKMAQTQLTNMVVTRCGCKYGLPFAKD